MKNLISQGLRLGQKISKGFRKWLKDKMGKCVNCAKSVMQIFKLTKLTEQIFATYATYASANFVGKESNESTEMYRVKSRIPSIYSRLTSDSNLSRFCVVSLIYANKLLNHRTTPLGRFVLPEHLPFSKPKVNWLLHVSLICLCMLTVGSGNVWGATATFTASSYGWTNGQSTGNPTTKTVDGVTFNFAGGSTNPTYYTADGLRTYENCVITISSTNTITGIVFTYTTSNSGYLKSFNTGTWTSGTKTWSGSATSINCTVGHSSGTKNGQVRITSIVVTYTPSAASHTLSSAVSPAASGTVDLSATSVAEGSTATATATPATHYVFDHWSISGTGSTLSSTTTNPTTVTMGTANTTVTAYFVAAPKASITLSEAGATTTDASTYYVGDSYTLPSSTEASCGTKVLVGWSTVEVAETNTKPTSNFYEKGETVTLAATQTFYAVFATASGGGGAEWAETTIGDLTGSDIFVLATPGGYAVSNNNGTSSAPTAISITVSAGKITSTVTDAMKWNLGGNSTDGYIFYPNGTTTTWLYCSTTASSGSNNNIRVGTGDRKHWIADGDGDYVTNDNYTDRWLCNYNNADFRGYVGSSVTSDIVSKFYKYSAGTTYSAYSTTCAASHTVSAAVDPAGKATVTLGATSVAEGSTTTATYSNVTNGYEFVNWTISGSGATLSSTTATTTTITMGTANVTVTANLQCVTPTFTASPASKTDYLTTDSPTALEYTASAAGASLASQWQVSTDNSNWSDIAAVDGGTAATYTPTISTAGTKYYRVIVTNSAAGCSSAKATSNVATITSTAPSGYCISIWNSSNNGIQSGFNNGGSGNEYTMSFTVPGKDGSNNWPEYWIGENNSFQSAFSVNATLADMHFTHSNATLGLAAGATGTLHIWNNNIEANSNLWVKFEPSGYGLRWGGAGEWDQAVNTKAFTVDPGDANVYWTDIVTLDGTNNTTWNYYVGLQTASGYVYSGVDDEEHDGRGLSRTTSVTAMKVSNGTSGSFKATYLNSEATGTRGKFRIWDNNITSYNFVCHFVPFYRVTYEGSGADGSTAASADVCCEGNQAARTVQAAANEFTVPTGKSFGGWASSPENAAAGVVAYAAGANIILTQSITLYAIWLDIDYTVTVNQSPAAGATTTGQGTAHYNDAVNLTTTVPAGYRFVNWTTSDGFSITNPTSATTASFTMPAKNVTVTANFQQTHKVDWYVGGSAPANKIGDDGQTTVVDHGGKISDFPATTPDGTPCDKTFVGWTNTSSYKHGTSPLFNDVAGSPTINADASFYAVFAEVNSVSASLTKMTADDDLEVGDKIVIIAQDTRYGMYQASASSYVSYWTTTDMDGEPSLSEIEADDKKYLDVAAGSASNTWKLGDATNGYLYNASSTNLEFSTTNSSDLTLITWTDDSFTLQAGQYISCRTDITGANANKWRGAGASCDPENDNNCSGTEYYYLYKYVPGGTTYTGHTINCADCGTSVTVSYSAPGSGNTMAVTKNAAAVASGSTVKTCTSQDLTVTLTPATHYDLTGFTATGLTTGTATITPAVGSTLPVSVAQTFTVTVSAGATGTLTLDPTFTAQTPLSITLETHSKGTFTPIGDIYSGESFTFPTVTPSDAECSSFLGWIEGTTWSGDGTETDPTAITGLANYHAAGSSSGTLTTTKTYTAVFGEKDTQVIPAYQKVTSAPSNWSGDYLIVRDDNSRAFDGSLSTLDAADNYIGVTISDGSITANSTVNASKWTIAKVGETSNYTIKSASGYYIGRTANSNGLNSSTSEEYTNTLAYSTDHVDITSSAGPKLQMNGGARFRYYGTSQQVLQLYKYNPDAEVVAYTYCTNPACTPRYRVTMNSATGGSPSADKVYEHADETITLTANPSSGYSFTSWTITKTTGGDNVTSTLLTGDKPTTANTTFTMPAYDITIAATYTKKMVSTLEVKDGATVVSTTTGPVSGTVNISTGANKTLDVVITPSDAYDHSWTATVSAGSTYASITNVTDDGFRVNGLAQGDATITVNAPNDGSAKSVTLTVQVRDIMPEEIILKRDGSNTPIETLIMYYDETNSKGQYVKVNVGYSPANPTNKAFTFSSALTGKVGSHSHAPASGYEVLVANGVTSDAVNCTFTSSADGSVTKVLAVTVLPILSDRFVDYVHGNATQTVSARLSDDRYSIIPDINTPSLSDASDANPTSEDCETSHYHLVGWLPQTTAEALWAAGTPITDATEGLVRAGESVEATGQTWCAIWAEEAE